jgi:hypothetical protein
MGSAAIGTVQTMPAESGGKSWLKEISMGERVFRRIFPATDEPHQQKNAVSHKGKRRFVRS